MKTNQILKLILLIVCSLFFYNASHSTNVNLVFVILAGIATITSFVWLVFPIPGKQTNNKNKGN